MMATQHSGTPELAAALDLGINPRSPAELRREALRQMFAHQPPRAVTEAAAVLETKTDPLTQQEALRLLGTAASADADAVMSIWLGRLAENRVSPAIQLDLLEAAASREGLKPKAEAYLQAHPTNAELLEGGDVANGKDIATNHLGANCLACHTIEAKEGSQVGPNLKIIGSQKDRAYILESLLNPTAKVAPGYGLVSVTLKDGKNISGSLDKEDTTQLVLRMADGKTQTLARDDIASATPPISVMPPMLGILTKPQIRDLVAYLASLKSKSTKKK